MPDDIFATDNLPNPMPTPYKKKEEEDQNEIPAPVPSPLPEPTPAPVPRDETKTLNEVYAGRQTMQFNELVTGKQNPFADELNRQKSYRAESDQIAGMYADPENLGGLAPDVVNLSTNSIDPSLFKQMATNWKATAFMLDTPVDQLKDSDYTLYKKLVAAKLGKNAPKTENEYHAMLSQHFGKQKEMDVAVDELNMAAVMDALNATNYGENFPMVRDQGRTISAWMQKYPDLATPDRQWLLARSAGAIYNQTLSDIKDVQQYVAPTYKTLVDFTQGKATEDQLDNLGRNLRDLTSEQFNKVGQYVTLAAESQQIDRGAWVQLAKNLGQSLSRGFDWIPASDIFSGQAEAANRIKAVEKDDVWVPVDSESLPAGEYQNPRTARELPKYLQMASMGKPDETGYEEPLQGNWRKATPEEKELIRQNAEDGMKSMKMVRKLRNLAKTGVDPINPLAQGGLLGAVERGAYGLAGSIPLMGAVAVNPFFGVLAYQQNELDRILIENENMDLGAASTLALVEGGMNAVIDRFQIASLAGKSKVFGGVLKGMQKGGVANFLKRVGVIQTEQFLQEGAQDLIAPVVETIAASLREDMPDKNFMEELGNWWETRPEVFFATLPLALIGGGFASTGDLKNVNTEVTRERLRGAGISEEKINSILTSETRAEMDERIQEAWQSRTEEDKARGLEYLNQQLQQIKQTDTDHSLAVERKEDGTAEWVVTDYKGEQVGRFADMDAAMEVISQNTAANLTNEKSTTAELLNWASKVLENPDISPDEKPLSVTQKMQEMQGIGDQKGIDNLMARLKFGDLQGKDPNKLYILGETTIEQVKEGVYRAVIKLKENASPLDALEEINHGFFKVALANGTYTLDTYQKWLEQTEAATGRELKRATEMEVIESLARVTEDYVMGRIDETSMPQSFVDYIKRIAAVFKEALARFLKMDEAFKTGAIDTDFQTALEQSLGIDPQVRLDRISDQTAASIDPNLSVRDTSGENTPYKDRDKDPAAPLTETEIREGVEAESGVTGDFTIDPNVWAKLDDDLPSYSIRKGPPKEGKIPNITYSTLQGKRAFVYFADRMRVGVYKGLDPKSGINIPLQGGPSYPFTIGNIEDGAGWAFSDDGSVFSTFNNRVNDTDGIGVICLYTEGNIRGNETFLQAYMAEVRWAVKSGKLTESTWLDEANRIREATLKKRRRDGTTIGDGKAKWIPLWKEQWKSIDEAQKALSSTTFDIRGGSFFGYEPNKKGQKGSIIGADKLISKGFPNIHDMVAAMEDPRFKGLEYGDMVGAVQYEQGQTKASSAKDLNVREHISYPVIIKGKGIGFFQKPKSVLDVIQTSKPRAAALRAISMSMTPTSFSVRETKKSAKEIEKIVGAMSASDIRTKLESSKLTPTPRMVAMLGEFPEYLEPIVEYMMEKRQDLVDGKVSPRDVAKAYWMTIASIGADAIDVETIGKKAQAEGIPFNPDPMFTTTGTRGQLQMRPEELAAYWLGTPEGQRALDNVEKGVFNAEDWETGLLLRDAFGRNDLRERWRVTGKGTPNTEATIVVDGAAVQVEVNEKGNWSFSLEEQNTPVELPEGMTEGKRVQTSGSVGLPKGKKANLTNLKELTDRINSAKGDPEKLEKAVMSAVGIGEGKKGFVSHFLGFGGWSTIDAVELNMWLAGVGDTTRATEDQKMIAAIAKKASGQAATRRDLFERIRKAILGLRDKAKGGKKIPKEVAPHIIHHWIWDAAKDIQTTHEGLYYAMQNYSVREQDEIDRVAAAVDAVNRGPEGRLAVYQRAKEKFLQLMQDNRDALDAIKTAAITDPAPALEKLEEDRAGRIADIETEENAEVQSALQDNAVQFATRIEDANSEDKAQLNADAKDRAKILEKGIREKYAERKKQVEQEIAAEKRKVSEVSESRRVASNAVYREKVKYEKLAQAVAELDGLLKVLPKEVIGKVGGFATLTKIGGGEKALANFFVKRVEMVDTQLERYLNEEYDKQLDRIFERSKPKKANAGEKPKGIGADIQSLFSSLIASKSMTGAEVSAHLAGLDDKLNNPDLDLSPEEEARIMQEQALVTLVGDWKNADSNRRAAAVDALRETWAKGYSAFTANKIAEKDARVKAQQEAIVSTGKAGDYPERQTKLQKDLGIAGKLKNDLLDFVSWDQLLGLIFGDNSFTANRYSDLQRIAENSKEDSIQNKVEALESLFTRLAGGKRLDGEKLRWQLSQPSMVVNGLKLSELEGLTASMMWMQEDGKRHMEGRRDENGKIISRWSYNQNFIDQIEGSLSDEAKEVRRFLLDNYDREYQRINAVYRQLNGINLPRIQFYSPLIVAPQQAPQGMINDPVTGTPVSAASASPAALRTRGKSVIAEPQFRDALQTFIAHTKQMEHWIAYAPILKDLNGVLRNRDVQNSVLEKTGKESTGVLNLWLDLFAQGGNRDASNQLDFSKQVHSVAGRFAQVALVGRIGTLLVQSTQLAAALGEVPLGSYMVRLSKLLTGNLGWGAALKSDYIQRRLKEMPPVVQEAMRGLDSDKPNRLKYSVQKLGRLISGTDALFTAGTFAIVHDYHLTQAKKMGLSDAQAKEYADRTAERATDRVAQPTRMGSKSMVELTSTNAFAKVGWAFASEARKNFALATYALANKSFSEKARVLGLFLTANTILSGIIRNAWRDARDEEDDEWFDEKNWSPERMMLAMATEPLQGIPLVGSAIQDATYAAAGEYHQQGGMLSSVRAIRAMRHLPETLNGERDIEDMLKDLNGVMSLMGLFNQNLAAAASLSTLASDVFGLGKNTKKMMEE